MFFLRRWGDVPVGIIKVPVVDLVSVPLPGPEATFPVLLLPGFLLAFAAVFLHRNLCPSKGPTPLDQGLFGL